MNSARYEARTHIVSRQGAELRYCAVHAYSPAWRSVPHSHTHAEVFCVTEGLGQLQAGGEFFSLQPGMCAVVNSFVMHTEFSSPSSPLGYIVVGADNLSFTNAQGRPVRCAVFADRGRTLQPYFEDLMSELSRRQAGYDAVCGDILGALLSKIARRVGVDASAVERAPGSAECIEASRLIDERFQEDLTLDVLAQRVGLSKFYLSRSFRSCYGVSPMRRLSQRRVQEAMHLLLNSDYSHETVAQLCGFSSASYFCQAFKRAVGVSPGEYRRSGGAAGNGPASET